jgi:hypothetical protein
MALVAAVAGGVRAADKGAGPADNPPHKEAVKEPVSVERINRLIKQLGDKDYYVRQRAQDELARLGFEAFDALGAATTNVSPETATQVPKPSPAWRRPTAAGFR